MRTLKIWLRLLLRSNRQQPVRRAVEDNRQGRPCFDAWIRAYREKLGNDRQAQSKRL